MRFKRSGAQRSTTPRARVFFASDLHGATSCFKKFLSAGRVYEASVLVLGGDLAGKSITPLVRTGEGYRVGGAGLLLQEGSELGDFRRQCAARGGYPMVLEADEAEALQHDHQRAADAIQHEAIIRVQEWVELAQERLPAMGLECYVTGGNDDTPAFLDVLPREGPFRFCEGEVVEMLDGAYQIASFGWSNPTPWKTPRETDEATLDERLAAILEGVTEPSRTLFNVHVPPVGSGLDRCPQLDTSTDPPTPIKIAGELQMFDAGSTAVRAAIERHQPVVSLHGHIHESRGMARIGSTVAINPGSTYGEGLLQGVVIGLGDDVVHQFTTG